MSLSEVSPGQFQLSGAINFATAPDIEQQGGRLLLATDSAKWRIDLAGITQADSSALAVCLAWVRLARANRKTIIFTAAPIELSALADVCGIGELLGISATRCPPPAARKSPTVCAFAGSGQREAGSGL